MFDKPFSTIFGIGLFIWIGMILLESTPAARLDTACSPVRWGGNIMQSLAALSDSEKFVEKVAIGTDEVDYGCQFTLWRLVYGKTYAKQGGAMPEQAARVSPGLAPGGISPDDSRVAGDHEMGSGKKKRAVLIEKSGE